MKAKLYSPIPGGRKIQDVEITQIRDEDEEYLTMHNIKVSMEELATGVFAVYFDDGKHIDDNPEEDPDEIIVLSVGDKSCEDCMAEGVRLLKARVK